MGRKQTEIPVDTRDAFLATAEARMSASSYSKYLGAEFKREADHLLVIFESC